MIVPRARLIQHGGFLGWVCHLNCDLHRLPGQQVLTKDRQREAMPEYIILRAREIR
jgi:hypothetical protein